MENAIRWFCIGVLAGSLMWCLQSAPGIRGMDGAIDAAHAQDAGADTCPDCCQAPCLTRTVYSGQIGTDGTLEVQLQDFDPDDLPAIHVYQLGTIGAPPTFWLAVDFELTTAGDVRVQLPNQEGRSIRIVVVQ